MKQVSDVFEGGRQGRPQVLDGFEIRCAHNKLTRRESPGHDVTQPDRVTVQLPLPTTVTSDVRVAHAG